MGYMTFNEFMEKIGITNYKTAEWVTENKEEIFSDPLALKVDGPYVDEFGEMICAVRIPDVLWKRLVENRN